MAKIKISQKGLYAGISFIIASFLFFSFLYLPKARELEELKEWMQTIDSELSDIEGLTSNGVSLPEFIGELQKKVQFLNDKFPSSEREAMKGLSKLASQHGLEVISIKSSIEGLGKKKAAFMSMRGRNVKKAYLDIDISGGYIQLGRFLEEARKEFKNFVALDRLFIKKTTNGERLKIQVRFFLYLMI